MPLFRGSKNATIVNGEIVATAQDIADAVNDAIAAKNAAEAAANTVAEDFVLEIDSEVRDFFSASGDISYDSSTGVFSFTETPNYTDADVDAHLSGGTGVTYTSGDISIGQDVGTGASVTFLDAEFTGTGAVELPEGTEGQRPDTPASGMIRFNSDAGAFEGYNGSEWGEIGGGIPSGAVQYFAMDTAPDGWLKANGAEVSRSTYADLFAAIGTTFGAGDGSSTFELPDLRGEFIRGWDDGRGVDSGRSFGSNQSFATQRVTGDTGATGSNPTNPFYEGNTPQFGYGGGPGSGQKRMLYDNDRSVQTASETRPRNIALLACIKY